VYITIAYFIINKVKQKFYRITIKLVYYRVCHKQVYQPHRYDSHFCSQPASAYLHGVKWLNFKYLLKAEVKSS